MALSEMAIRHARITGKNYILADSDGVFLNITSIRPGAPSLDYPA